MKRYVVGFCFNRSLDKVVLIRKTRPEWQAGRLNGVGGKIEDGETPVHAMEREFREEACWSSQLQWIQFARLQGEDWEVHFFHAVNREGRAPFNESPEGLVSNHHVEVVLGRETSQCVVPLPNLRYLIPMALNHRRGEDRAPFFEIFETAGPRG